ncbi:uncharacterized protein J8A68_004868 [[Candida] subhashii]|uniref:Uncharacterized protein n=1 Tax=[Candida] subhashii TaxID=561895 RepID=A0A8J5QPZ0_9ASCO|nr:uncharacterized protein J8A68_004868 [[Candida] subhashii]KAG7661600.1 hypothetical protein J8A68_004868 [[Candida] subhashii]
MFAGVDDNIAPIFTYDLEANSLQDPNGIYFEGTESGILGSPEAPDPADKKWSIVGSKLLWDGIDAFFVCSQVENLPNVVPYNIQIIEDQGCSPIGLFVKEVSGDGSGSSTDDGSGGSTDDGSGSSTDDGSASSTDEGSGGSTDDGSGSSTDDGSGSSTDDGSGSSTDHGSGSSTDDGSGSSTDDGSGSSTDDGSGGSTDTGGSSISCTDSLVTTTITTEELVTSLVCPTDCEVHTSFDLITTVVLVSNGSVTTETTSSSRLITDCPGCTSSTGTVTHTLTSTIAGACDNSGGTNNTNGGDDNNSNGGGNNDNGGGNNSGGGNNNGGTTSNGGSTNNGGTNSNSGSNSNGGNSNTNTNSATTLEGNAGSIELQSGFTFFGILLISIFT